jgi:hypothetical protein
MSTIKVIVCRVGRQPAVEEMENALHAFQELVGGYVEWVGFRRPAGCGIFCNEEGLLRRLPLNRKVPNAGPVHGDFVVCGMDEEGENRSLTDAEIAAIEPQLVFHSFHGDSCE